MKLPATATLDETPALAREIEAEFGGGEAGGARADATAAPFEIDASALSALDTSTLALLLHAQRLAKAAGRGFRVVGAPAKLMELAALYGVDGLLHSEAAPA